MAADTHCFVCNTAIEPDQPPIHIGATTVAQQHNTKHTGRSVFELLEEFLGYSLQAQRSATNRWCVECLERANEYDLAMQTARRCEAELVQVFNDTENAVTTNAAAEPEDVEDTVAAASDQLDDELWPLKIEELDENELEELEQFQNEQRLRDDENFDVDDDDNDEDFDQQSISAVYLSDEIGNAEEGYSEDKPDIVCDSPTKHPATILFKCTHCNADFETNGDFKVHIRACKASNRRAPLTCPTCGLPCHTRAALSIHMALHNGITPFECDACGKQFSHRGAMVRHMVLHTGVKAFQCDKCGKQFIHHSSFHMHRRAHDNVRDQQCTICGLELRSSSHLTRHMRVHSGEKPYACPECGQRFAQRYNMMTHFKAHHGIHRSSAGYRRQGHRCAICDETFGRALELREHLYTSGHGTADEGADEDDGAGGAVALTQKQRRRTATKVARVEQRLADDYEEVLVMGIDGVAAAGADDEESVGGLWEVEETESN